MVRCRCQVLWSESLWNDLLGAVCGANGKSYANECLAKNAKTKVQYEGECHPAFNPACICNTLFAPVCGTNNQTFPNACNAGEFDTTAAEIGSRIGVQQLEGCMGWGTQPAMSGAPPPGP